MIEMKLDADEFSQVIKNAPLVSIDLILKDARGMYLLGKRKNAPAKGYWFVPGGVIHKDQTLEAAFNNITVGELGKEYSIKSAAFLGVHEHF
jgi:colanic acid biosynthesis protein WcaH